MVISLHMPLLLKMSLLGSKSRVWEQSTIQSPRAQEPQRRCDPGEEASIPSQGKEEHVTREVPLLSLALSLFTKCAYGKKSKITACWLEKQFVSLNKSHFLLLCLLPVQASLHGHWEQHFGPWLAVYPVPFHRRKPPSILALHSIQAHTQLYKGPKDGN